MAASFRNNDTQAHVSPYLFVLGAAVLWSTGGLFIKLGKAGGLSDAELSCGRALFSAATVMLLTRREGFGLNRVTAAAAVLYALLLYLFVRATMLTTAANAIFLQYTAPVYILLLEPLVYRARYRAQDFAVVACCRSFNAGHAVRHRACNHPASCSGSGCASHAAKFTQAAQSCLRRHPGMTRRKA